MWAYNGSRRDAASARSAAIDTPSSALAPSRLLVAVPSRPNHGLVESPLVEVPVDDRGGDFAVDVGDRLTDTFADEARPVAVAQLERLALARRGSRRHRGTPERAIVERDVHFDRRITARIQNLATVDSC